MDLKDKLIKLGATCSALSWVGDMDLQEAWSKCERGDWMLILAWKMKDKKGWSGIREITLAKVRCARLVEHLMKGQISIDALNLAEQYALGKTTRKKLDAIAADAATYADAIYADVIYADADDDVTYADYATAYAAYVAADATAYATYVAVGVAHTAYTAADRDEILKQCADICRKTLKIGKF